jgi:hypothetical protein
MVKNETIAKPDDAAADAVSRSTAYGLTFDN